MYQKLNLQIFRTWKLEKYAVFKYTSIDDNQFNLLLRLLHVCDTIVQTTFSASGVLYL